MTRFIDQTDTRLHHSGTDFRDDEFSGFIWDFDNTRLTFHNCKFEQIQFRERAIELSAFQHCQFVDCRFDSAQIRECQFEDCQFYERETEQTCSFKFSDLTATRFTRCDISMCNFSRSKIYRTEFIQCQAQGIDCSHAQAANTVGNTVVLQGAKMHDCNFAYADFSGAELAESELTNNRMSHCLLHRADLSGTQLVDCELHGIDATGITLRGADLRGSDLTGLDVREVDMTEVIINSFQQTMLLETLGMIIDDT